MAVGAKSKMCKDVCHSWIVFKVRLGRFGKKVDEHDERNRTPANSNVSSRLYVRTGRLKADIYCN